MKRSDVRCRIFFGLVLALSGARALAEPAALDEEPALLPEELRSAMVEFFAERLRAELVLSDEQAARVLPHLERLEREGHELRRERADTLRQLRRGLEDGASDAELKPLLAALDRYDGAQHELRRSVLSEVDSELNVRQSIHLRLFLVRFPRLVREQLSEIRGDRPLRPARPR
jgi:hypothetical protein